MKQLELKMIPKLLCEIHDLIVLEAQYHHSCYCNYSRSVPTLIDMERDPKVQLMNSNLFRANSN